MRETFLCRCGSIPIAFASSRSALPGLGLLKIVTMQHVRSRRLKWPLEVILNHQSKGPAGSRLAGFSRRGNRCDDVWPCRN
jgi:hypothetical protein